MWDILQCKPTPICVKGLISKYLTPLMSFQASLVCFHLKLVLFVLLASKFLSSVNSFMSPTFLYFYKIQIKGKKKSISQSSHMLIGKHKLWRVNFCRFFVYLSFLFKCYINVLEWNLKQYQSQYLQVYKKWNVTVRRITELFPFKCQ